MTYTIIPIKMSAANEFVTMHHRHNKAVDHRSHRFSLGLTCEGKLIGAAIAGLPIARIHNDGFEHGRRVLSCLGTFMMKLN